MRIAMMGTGGIGGYFGGRLAAAGNDVAFIARGAHLDAIREAGLRIESDEYPDAHIEDAFATDDPAAVGPVDAVIVGVKLWDTKDAAQAILPMLGPETLVVSLQNGVECNGIIGPIVGQDRLIGGMAQIASTIAAPGVIKHIGTMQRIVIGDFGGGTSARTQALCDALVAAGIDAEIGDDIERSLWEKFVFLIGLSATTCLMRTTIGPIREDPDRRAILYDAMAETAAVGRAKGIDLPEGFGTDRLSFIDKLPAAMTSSMHHDLERGNLLEVAWLSGAVARLGADLGIPTPVNATVFATLKSHAAPGPE